MIKKFIDNETVYEVGDFYNGTEEENVISYIRMDGRKLIITTNHEEHHVPIRGGEYLLMLDGTTQVVAKKGNEQHN